MRVDLTGNTYGELTVIRYSHNDKVTRSPKWLCRCSCGNEKAIYGYALEHGHYRSCGCKRDSKRDAGLKRHIKSDSVNGTRKSAFNAKLHRGNTSGRKGVTYNERRKKWRAYIGFKGKQISLGYYDDVQDAIKARVAAEEKYFKPILEDEKMKYK